MKQHFPRAVLFACYHNSVRSPMAQGLLRFYALQKIYVASCGVAPCPLDPFAVQVMEESGISIAHHQPKSFAELEDTSFDLLISLAPQAHRYALEWTRTLAIDVEYWPTFDPSELSGSREQILISYRSLRDQLFQKIKKRFPFFGK